MAFNNYYGFNSWNRFGWNNWYGPSLSIGFGYGRPWGYGGGWYGNPWYNNWYGSGWYGSGWGHGWYGSGWYGGGGWYGGVIPGTAVMAAITTPRARQIPTAPRNFQLRVYTTDGSRTYRPNTNGSAPRRQYDSNSGRPVTQPSTRRTFERSSGERPAAQPAPQRQRSSRDYERNYDRSNSAPARQQPSYTPERSSAPQRSYTPPSSSPSSSPSSAPSRSRPRG